MKKYLAVFVLFWQENLQLRATFFFERFRSLVAVVSFYYLWSTLLAGRESFAGYDHTEMMTYVLGMNVMRSLIFSSRYDEMIYEISRGQLSTFLLKPVTYFGFALMRDLSTKSIHILSAFCEVIGLIFIFDLQVKWMSDPVVLAQFLAIVIMSVMLYFLIVFIVCSFAFWTAESWGPLFALEVLIEFTAGAFFPLDILPASLQAVLKLLPSPYLVFFPINVFLGRLDPALVWQGMGMQMVWIAALALTARWIWHKGLVAYGAEGS